MLSFYETPIDFAVALWLPCIFQIKTNEHIAHLNPMPFVREDVRKIKNIKVSFLDLGLTLKYMVLKLHKKGSLLIDVLIANICSPCSMVQLKRELIN